jgi:predicted P-loop ATPase
MIKSKSETIKNFLSRKIITERLPYAKRVQTLPRLASLIGTDNEARPLRDTTGNRRFAVIPVERIRLDELQNVLPLDRLWGGVPYLLYLNQTPVVQGNAQIIINDVNEDAVEHDQWSEILLEKLVFDEFGKCTSSEIFSSVLGVCIADQDQTKKRRLGQILNSVEFRKLGVFPSSEWLENKKRRIWKGCKI